MTAEQWQQIKTIVQMVIEIEPEKRTCFIIENCADDKFLRGEVQSLLDSYENAGEFIQTPAFVGKLQILATSNFTAKLTSGKRVGRYEIRSLIGEGGMGEVYLAEDTRLHRKVALKVLPADLVNNRERLHRFEQEAQAASALNHPNIITIYEIGESQNTNFIAIEYIEGVTLHNRLKSERMSLKEMLDIAIQIISALQAAHGAGIVHRDIKPENVMVRHDGFVKILDFGIAKLTERKNETDSEVATAIKFQTSPGMIIGTPNYMSPEQAIGKQIDARTDIFSFGIMLYEMLTGKQPFEGESAMETIGSILNKEPAPLHKLMPDVPPEIERIINKALRKDREERYQTAKDLLIDLKDVKQDLEFLNKLERTSAPNREEAKTQAFNAATNDAGIHTTSSAEYVVGEIRNHKRGFTIGLTILLLASIGLGYWFFANRSLNTKQIESVAVLPFVNESGNADAEYLSDGMTESLITSLSQLPKLNVKARNSVFRYKGKEVEPRKVGAELSVQAVLLGRVIQRGNDLTLYIELIDANTENILWKADYNRPMSNLLSLQSEIARDVSQKLQARISNVEAQRVAKSYTANAEAYQLYLKGRFYWNRRTAENIKKAIEQFRLATEKDPNYALAYVGLADSYIALGNYADASTNETLPQAKAYAMRAVELDDSLAEVHTSLGNISIHSWNWAEAERSYKRAIELNPNYPTAHQWYSLWLTFNGRLDEALTEIKHAYDLDPLSPIINANLARTYLLNGELDIAAEQCRKFIEFDPTQPQAYMILAFIRQKQLRHSEAIAEAGKAVELSQRASDKLAALGYFYAAAGKRAQALEVLSELKVKYESQKSKAAYIAWVYAGLGDNNEAFAWLEKDFLVRDGFLAQNVTIYTALDSLRSDHRYAELLQRIGLSHTVK